MKFGLRSLLLGFVCLILRGFGQTADPASQPSAPVASSPATTRVEMPSDPAALLELAAKKNGLRNVRSAPWHLKASYEVLDDSGRTTDSGTFEEFWASSDKSRSIYTSAHFNQTSIANNEGFYREGDLDPPRGAGSLVRSTLFHGATTLRDIRKSKLTLDDRTLGSVKLKCITIVPATPAFVPPMALNCVDNALPVLRINVGPMGFMQTLYGEVTIFQGIYIARNIELKSGSRTILRVHIDTLEPYALKDESLFLPGAHAVVFPRRAIEPVEVGDIVSKVAPSYPVLAKQQGIQGVVILHATITPEGRVADLQPIVGPPALISPSLDAVKKWQYHPYLLDGVPVGVETDISVVFSLGS